MSAVDAWSNAQCIQWIKTLSLPSGWSSKKVRKFTTFKSKFVEMFIENKIYVGNNLKSFCQTDAILLKAFEDEYDEEEDLYSPPLEFCTFVCQVFVVKLREGNSSAGYFDNLHGNGSNNNTSNTNDNTKFNVVIIGCPNKSRVEIKVSSSNTISDLKNFIYDKEGQVPETFNLKCGQELTDLTKTLKYYKIGAGTRVTFWTKVVGGTALPVTTKNRRHINFAKHKHIKPSHLPDCLFMYKLSEGYSVAQMSCGHAMECESMFMYIKSMFTNNCASVNMHCPIPKCKREWDWQTCCVVAGLTEDENDDLSRKRELRQSIDMRECPNCSGMCKRHPSVAILRMRCLACKGPDWCWECSQVWRGSGLVICNNKSCDFVQQINEELRTSTLEVPYGWKDLKVPDDEKKLPNMRVCPACLAFLEKPSGCKHMTCHACKHKFCYSCLKSQAECINSQYNVLCKPHAVQEFK